MRCSLHRSCSPCPKEISRADCALCSQHHQYAGSAVPLEVTAWSPVDILVLNASIDLPEAYQGISRERFDKQISVNLRSPLELLQALVPSMAARGWGRS